MWHSQALVRLLEIAMSFHAFMSACCDIFQNVQHDVFVAMRDCTVHWLVLMCMSVHAGTCYDL